MFQESQKIGLYTLIRKLGEGGFGEVWLAEDRHQSPSEKVAIKLPKEKIKFKFLDISKLAASEANR